MRGLESSVEEILLPCHVTSDVNKVAWALKALTLTDLTTLAGDDCKSNVERLCIRAVYPFLKHSINNNSNDDFMKKLHVAAVCVYPAKVNDAQNTLKRLDMLDKIQIAAGETEIVVIILIYNFSLSLSRHWVSNWSIWNKNTPR